MRKTSRFGEYEGYSQAIYDGFQRHSLYVEARDGVRLALDYFLPTAGGVTANEALPAILQLTPYNRAQIQHGQLVHVLSPYRPYEEKNSNNLLELSRHGYVIVAFDVRGQGASFGTFTGCMTAEEGRDAADVIFWLRRQPWCNGKVGMLGSSYGGQTQFLAARERPEGLLALFPCHSLFDAYDVFFPGGIRQLSLPRTWGPMVDALAGRTAESTVAPVDGADGAALLAQAIAEHRGTPGASAVFDHIYSQSTRDGSGYFVNATSSGSQNLSAHLPAIQAAAIPAYHYGGWNDYYPAQAAMWFRNWTGAATKLAIGPWTHSPRLFTSPRDEEDLRLRGVESLRWFDYWLKGIDNGILDEAPVHYAVQDSHRYREGGFETETDHWEWRASAAWPIDGAAPVTYWLDDGRSGSIDSVNDGRLQRSPATSDSGSAMSVDPSVGTGSFDRMGSSFLFAPLRFPEMSAVDRRCLTWTTAPLPEDLTVTGIPEVSLFAQSDATDVNFVLWLEEVDGQGRSTLVTYGNLKASHRHVGQAPYDTAGLLWHPSTRDVIAATEPLNAGIAQIRLSLLPVANRFIQGHRLRLTVACADHGNLETMSVGARLEVLTGPSHPSILTLPIQGQPT